MRFYVAGLVITTALVVAVVAKPELKSAMDDLLQATRDQSEPGDMIDALLQSILGKYNYYTNIDSTVHWVHLVYDHSVCIHAWMLYIILFCTPMFFVHK